MFPSRLTRSVFSTAAKKTGAGKTGTEAMEFCDRHQFSVPYRRMGRIQVSTIEWPDRGDRSPLKKAHAPIGK